MNELDELMRYLLYHRHRLYGYLLPLYHIIVTKLLHLSSSSYAKTGFKTIKMMRCMKICYTLLFYTLLNSFQVQSVPTSQFPVAAESHTNSCHDISAELFADLEELSRIVDISYCVGLTGTGIQKPFKCASRCHEFQGFELVTVSSEFGGPLLFITLLIPSIKDMEHRPIFF